MDPLLWGPPFWAVLNGLTQMSVAPPEKEGACVVPRGTCVTVSPTCAVLTRLLELLRTTLPCPHCRASFDEYLHAHPVDICTDDVRLYIWNLRNDVNAKLRRHRIAFSVYCDLLECTDFSLPTNAVHMMHYVFLNEVRDGDAQAAQGEGTRAVREMFDLFSGLFAKHECPGWTELVQRVSGAHVAHALREAWLHEHRMRRSFRTASEPTEKEIASMYLRALTPRQPAAQRAPAAQRSSGAKGHERRKKVVLLDSRGRALRSVAGGFPASHR